MKGKLFNKMTDSRTLWKAWKKVKEKKSGGGIDNISIESFEKNLDENLKSLRLELANETYIPEPVKRISKPKESSKEKRYLGIPSIKDKIVQNALKIIIEPVFEKTFPGCVYGYRPGRGPKKAVQKTVQIRANTRFAPTYRIIPRLSGWVGVNLVFTRNSIIMSFETISLCSPCLC